MGAKTRAREYPRPRVLPRRAEQEDPLSGTRGIDYGPHADEAVRRSARTGGGDSPAGERSGGWFYYGRRNRRGWRIPRYDDLIIGRVICPVIIPLAIADHVRQVARPMVTNKLKELE